MRNLTWRTWCLLLYFIRALMYFTNSVHGPEHCTKKSSPPGVRRVPGTDSRRWTMSNWEEMENVNIMYHWAINQINPPVDHLHGLNVIYRAWQRQISMEHLFRNINYSLYSLEVTQEQNAPPPVSGLHSQKGETFTNSAVMLPEFPYRWLLKANHTMMSKYKMCTGCMRKDEETMDIWLECKIYVKWPDK